jgi:hypothetical protein
MEKIKPLSYENNAGIEENERKNSNDMIYIQTSEKVFKDFTSKRSKNSYNSPKCYQEE